MFDVIVVGGGAAGLMATRFAAAAGARTVLIERTRDGGRKILISGGGRCNVLPGTFRPERFVTASSANTLRKILKSWPLEEQRRYFEEVLRIPLKHEDEFDKLFPVSNKAIDVRDALVQAAFDAGAAIRFETAITDVGRTDEGGWFVEAEGGSRWGAPRLIMATGGLSVAATGSDGRGLSLVNRLGHTRHTTYPALTPLLTDPAVHKELSGVTLDVRIEVPVGKTRETFEGSFLFTHRGYSGPVALNVSHLAVRSALEGEPVRLEAAWGCMTSAQWEAALAPGAGTVGSALSASSLPSRLARQLAEEAQIPWDRSLGQLRKDERQTLVELLTSYPLPWTGDEGYKKAEVTGGGINLAEIDPRTMESRLCPGLYLCGEILDAFGPIGGHNFLWAWATGRAAGMAAGDSARDAGTD